MPDIDTVMDSILEIVEDMEYKERVIVLRALNKESSQAPVYTSGIAKCPTCNKKLEECDVYCNICGQKISKY